MPDCLSSSLHETNVILVPRPLIHHRGPELINSSLSGRPIRGPRVRSEGVLAGLSGRGWPSIRASNEPSQKNSFVVVVIITVVVAVVIMTLSAIVVVNVGFYRPCSYRHHHHLRNCFIVISPVSSLALSSSSSSSGNHLNGCLYKQQQ